MHPFETELLAHSVILSDKCQNVKVVEWKSSAGYEPSTAYSPLAKNMLNKICNFVVANFENFVGQHGLDPNDNPINIEISLLPADLDRNGGGIRNLNDFNYRFASRYCEYDENNQCLPIWGFYQRSLKHIYIRNDVLTDDGKYLSLRFRTVFAHELFHAISYQRGIFQQYKNDAQETDEQMARSFTKFLHYGE